jgi:polyhydroxyalkanoate synthesis regulator phasin
MMWEMWKKGFNAWESSTAKLMEDVLKSPLILSPSGKMMTGMMKAKAKSDGQMADAWSRVGLPTRRDQERTLHALNQLQSRILDLEEKLDSMKN